MNTRLSSHNPALIVQQASPAQVQRLHPSLAHQVNTARWQVSKYLERYTLKELRDRKVTTKVIAFLSL